MPRPRKPEKLRRVKLNTRVEPTLHDWLVEQVGLGRPYRTFAHAIDEAILALREKLDESSRRKR